MGAADGDELLPGSRDAKAASAVRGDEPSLLDARDAGATEGAGGAVGVPLGGVADDA